MGSVTNEQELGKRLQLARKRAGLTQQELCQKAGLSYSTLAKIERGAIKSPSVFTVAHIAAATNTPLEDLLELEMASRPPEADVPAKKRSKTGVRFVYFDINGTLVRYAQRGFTEASHELGVPVENIETVFWRHNDAVCSGQMSLEDFNATLARELGVSSFDWRKYYMDNVQAMPGMDELVRWTAEHYEVGIMSNNIVGFIDELKQKGLIPDVAYKAVVDSCRVGAAKPEAKIYQTAQELAAVPADEILLVDDTRNFLTAADRAGWQVLGFDEDHPENSISLIKAHLEF